MNNLAQKIERQYKPIEKQVRNPKKKQKRFPSITKGEKVLYSLTLIGMIIVSYLILSNYASIYIVNKDIVVLESTIAEQVRVNNDLQLQAAELGAPDRILHIAKEQLGMKLDENQVKVVQN